MTPEERQALERRISELLEPEPEQLRQYKGPRSYDGTFKLKQSERGAWVPRWQESGPTSLVPCTHWHPLDWTTDETANARLRDMMLAYGYQLLYVRQGDGRILLWLDQTTKFLADNVRECNCLAVAGWLPSLSAEERAEVLK